MLSNDFETLRYYYKPEKVKVLFVGESRPHGGTFFYYENSNLYRNIKTVFNIYFLHDKFSLDNFKSLGCWIYDICEQPVNNLKDRERRQAIRTGLPGLRSVIEKEKPDYIIVCKKGSVQIEIRRSDIMSPYTENITLFFLPFPACGQQGRFKEKLVEIFKDIDFENL